MLKSKKIKTILSAFMLLLACWVAVPKVYIHQILHHNHLSAPISNQTEVRSQSADDCDFENYDKPAYFSIFKFIFSFLPVKANENEKVFNRTLKLSNLIFAIPLFRGPPSSN